MLSDSEATAELVAPSFKLLKDKLESHKTAAMLQAGVDGGGADARREGIESLAGMASVRWRINSSLFFEVNRKHEPVAEMIAEPTDQPAATGPEQ